MTPEQELQRADEARRILETPIVTETLDLMEREIMEAWIACPARDSEGRDWLWRQIVVTRKFRDCLKGTMESGKIAAESLRRQQDSLAKRTINYFR